MLLVGLFLTDALLAQNAAWLRTEGHVEPKAAYLAIKVSTTKACFEEFTHSKDQKSRILFSNLISDKAYCIGLLNYTEAYSSPQTVAGSKKIKPFERNVLYRTPRFPLANFTNQFIENYLIDYLVKRAVATFAEPSDVLLRVYTEFDRKSGLSRLLFHIDGGLFENLKSFPRHYAFESVLDLEDSVILEEDTDCPIPTFWDWMTEVITSYPRTLIASTLGVMTYGFYNYVGKIYRDRKIGLEKQRSADKLRDLQRKYSKSDRASFNVAKATLSKNMGTPFSFTSGGELVLNSPRDNEKGRQRSRTMTDEFNARTFLYEVARIGEAEILRRPRATEAPFVFLTTGELRVRIYERNETISLKNLTDEQFIRLLIDAMQKAEPPVRDGYAVFVIRLIEKLFERAKQQTGAPDDPIMEIYNQISAWLEMIGPIPQQRKR